MRVIEATAAIGIVVAAGVAAGPFIAEYQQAAHTTVVSSYGEVGQTLNIASAGAVNGAVFALSAPGGTPGAWSPSVTTCQSEAFDLYVAHLDGSGQVDPASIEVAAVPVEETYTVCMNLNEGRVQVAALSTESDQHSTLETAFRWDSARGGAQNGREVGSDWTWLR